MGGAPATGEAGRAAGAGGRYHPHFGRPLARRFLVSGHSILAMPHLLVSMLYDTFCRDVRHLSANGLKLSSTTKSRTSNVGIIVTRASCDGLWGTPGSHWPTPLTVGYMWPILCAHEATYTGFSRKLQYVRIFWSRVSAHVQVAQDTPALGCIDSCFGTVLPVKHADAGNAHFFLLSTKDVCRSALSGPHRLLVMTLVRGRHSSQRP